MGLAASQGRYLCLTARNSDLVYEGQQISQQRLNLATETQEIADKYTEAMNNTILQSTTAEGGTQQLTYETIINQDPYTGLCMRIVDLNGNVVVPGKGESISVTSEDEDGEETTSTFSTSSEFISLYMSDLDEETSASMSNKSLSYLVDYYNENYSDSGYTVTYNKSSYSDLKNDDERYSYDENCTDAEYLQNMLTSGQWLLEKVSTSDESGWESIVWQGSSAISEVYDTSDDAAAEAEYESDMTALEKRDKILELRLEQVETEQSSVQTEMESIKQVIDKNIEDSFKTFA